MTDESTPAPRAGSGQDLSRRMDALEARHTELAKDVTVLAQTVIRVEQNQTHAAELNKLRFDALDRSVDTVRTDLHLFMDRINGIISGEVKTPVMEQGAALVSDYQRWRKSTDDRLETIERSNLAAAERNRGVIETLGVGRTVLLLAFSIAGGLITVIDLITKVQHP